MALGTDSAWPCSLPLRAGWEGVLVQHFCRKNWAIENSLCQLLWSYCPNDHAGGRSWGLNISTNQSVVNLPLHEKQWFIYIYVYTYIFIHTYLFFGSSPGASCQSVHFCWDSHSAQIRGEKRCMMVYVELLGLSRRTSVQQLALQTL